jgi:predicted metal-dependent hydrolase
MISYDMLYVEFLYYFNVERDYFECHEVMEELWMEEGRNPLHQGLLQIAVALYHHRNGNVGGAIKLFSQGIEKLEYYPKLTLGIDLGKLVADSAAYLDKLLGIEEEPFEFYDLDIVILHSELTAMVEELKEFPPVKGS